MQDQDKILLLLTRNNKTYIQNLENEKVQL